MIFGKNNNIYIYIKFININVMLVVYVIIMCNKEYNKVCNFLYYLIVKII